VEDPEVRRPLKPWYRQFCKRPTFNDEYLATFNRPNVDAGGRLGCQGRGAHHREWRWWRTAVAYEVDCIIYATGFEITTSAHRRVDFDTIGRDGLSLYEHWKDGFRTLHGLSSHGFPNWFTIGINQNGLSPNMTAMFDDQAVHVSHIIREVLKRGKHVVEVTPRRSRRMGEEIVKLAGRHRAPRSSRSARRATTTARARAAAPACRTRRTRRASTRSTHCWQSGGTRAISTA
jgi:cyclohexanone monooxygenase